MQRRSGRDAAFRTHKLLSGARAGHVHRVAAPPYQACKKKRFDGFADAVLH